MERLSRTILVIFGITGDLARRKLLPALFNLASLGILPEGLRILGISRRGTTAGEILAGMRERAERDAGDHVGGSPSPDVESTISFLARMLTIFDMNIGETGEYGRLAAELDRIEAMAGTPINRVFYLAIPSTLFATVTGRLGEPDINRHEPGVRECRFLIEKPFGYSLDSARGLIRDLSARFDPRQIYRIDHYLAKETAQNILAFRFENPLFSGIWNRRHISHIIVTAVESIGIEGRTAFYEGMGALRDLVQSHLLQLLALVTMERPSTMNDAAIHREKERLLADIRPPAKRLMASRTVRGQYATYRRETGKGESETETYAALRLSIANARWRGVPVFVRTGKAIREKITEINVVFRDGALPGRGNMLTIRIQPNEGIVIDLRIKKPGFEAAFEEVQLDFCYSGKLPGIQHEAYERVLVDAMRGDQTLFASDREVVSCWRITEPVLKAWKGGKVPLSPYDNGSWGPAEADGMAQRAGFSWPNDAHTVCTPLHLKNGASTDP